jgi:N-formylglutamate amidohydrolase
MRAYAKAVAVAFETHHAKSDKAAVLTVTHAGRDYPPGMIDRLAVPFDTVRLLEDRLADRLVEAAIARGWQTLVARTPRLTIDLNRAETDFEARAVAGAHTPAARPSHRARGGLGLVPERLGKLELWRTRLSSEDLAERIVAVYRPWHVAVEAALARAQAFNGHAVLIDVHSMPPLPGAHPAQIVIGDRHGASALPHVTAAAVEVFRAAGLRVAVNAPYAGAYMLERHGKPARNVSALQVEIDRRLYLDAALDGPGSGLSAMQRIIAALAERFTDTATAWPLAAE